MTGGLQGGKRVNLGKSRIFADALLSGKKSAKHSEDVSHWTGANLFRSSEKKDATDGVRTRASRWRKQVLSLPPYDG